MDVCDDSDADVIYIGSSSSAGVVTGVRDGLMKMEVPFEVQDSDLMRATRQSVGRYNFGDSSGSGSSGDPTGALTGVIGCGGQGK